MRVHIFVDQGLSELVGALLDCVFLLDLMLSFPALRSDHPLNTLELKVFLLLLSLLLFDPSLFGHGLNISIRRLLPFLQVNLAALIEVALRAFEYVIEGFIAEIFHEQLLHFTFFHLSISEACYGIFYYRAHLAGDFLVHSLVNLLIDLVLSQFRLGNSFFDICLSFLLHRFFHIIHSLA